jgi:VanZ family protein
MGQLHARVERLRRPALAGYVIVVLLATLTPFVPDFDAGRMQLRLWEAIFPSLAPGDVVDFARNIVLFAGWGLVWMATAPRGGGWRSVRRATLWGALLSTMVELCQVGSRNRYPSILDVLSNSCGSFLGAFCFGAVIYILRDHRDRKSYFGLPAAMLAAAYGAGVSLEAVVPFLRGSLGRVRGGVLRRVALVLAAFRWESVLWIPWEDILLFAPAGVLAVVALAEAGLPHREASRRVAWAGTLLAAVTELLHAPLGIPIVLGAALAHATAVALGAWAAGRWLAPLSTKVRGADRPRGLMTAYALLLVAWAWRPYIPEFDPGQYARKLHAPWWVPLALTGRSSDSFAIVDVSIPFLLAVPAGALLAVWPLRREGPLRTALPGIYLAFLLEAGQLFIVGREPDITDFLVAAAGVATGWLCLRRAGFQPYGELLPRPIADPQPEGAHR